MEAPQTVVLCDGLILTLSGIVVRFLQCLSEGKGKYAMAVGFGKYSLDYTKPFRRSQVHTTDKNDKKCSVQPYTTHKRAPTYA